MAPSAKSKKPTTSTKATKTKTTIPEKKAITPPPVISEDEDGSDTESDNGGVDEEGMERLMTALGDDGLDDFEQEQLQSLMGDEDNEDDEGSSEEGDWVDADEDSQDEDVEGEDDEDADEEEDDAIALEDLEDSQSLDNDAVPRQKIEIDNHAALARIRETIQLDASLPWTETLVLSYPNTIDVEVDDDLNRELAFYKQALHGANAAKALAAKHKFPFTRPADYFAEMVKSDSHMERIRQRLLDEGASMKKSDDKRKERDGKKFGKQVQQEKLKERQQSKKEMEERLKGLKRKRKDVLDNAQGGDGDFDIAVEDAISDRPAKKSRGAAGGSKFTREARDSKFGYGAVGRREKQNTRESTDDFDHGSRKGSFRGGRGGARGRGGGRGGARGGARGGRGGGGRGGGGGGRGESSGGGGGSGRHSSKRLGKSRRESGRGN